jgi:hypothetical protein
LDSIGVVFQKSRGEARRDNRKPASLSSAPAAALGRYVPTQPTVYRSPTCCGKYSVFTVDPAQQLNILESAFARHSPTNILGPHRPDTIAAEHELQLCHYRRR